MTKPSVSILMPVYNNEAYLSGTLDSLLAQTFRDFELIIIDDASTDGSGEIINDYSQRDKRIQVITNEQNVRVAGSLNRGLKLCRGELIARADGDDLYFPDRLEKQVKYMQANPEIGVAASSIQEIDEHNRVIRTVEEPTQDEDLRFLLNFGCIYIHPAVIMRKSLVDTVGGYDEVEFQHACQDYDLWARLSEHTQFGNVGEVLMQYRIHPESVCKTRGQEGMNLYCEVARRLLTKYTGEHLPFEDVKALVLFEAYGKKMSRAELDNIRDLLDHTLGVARQRESSNSIQILSRRLAKRYLAQSRMYAWDDREMSRQLFKTALKYDKNILYRRRTWEQAARLMIPVNLRQSILSG